MSPPQEPTVVQRAARSHQLGALLWVQPTVVKDGKMSERGEYFYERGMIIASGFLRLSARVHLWKNVQELTWDLYVKTWNNIEDYSLSQQIRVWHLAFRGGIMHTIELPEPIGSVSLAFASNEMTVAERKVWEAIIHESRGKVGDNLELYEQPIVMSSRVIVYHDGVELDGRRYKWGEVDKVWSFVQEKGFSLKREEQNTRVAIRIKVMVPPDAMEKIAARYSGYVPQSTPRFSNYVFRPDEIDLPLIQTLVPEMKLRRRGMDTLE